MIGFENLERVKQKVFFFIVIKLEEDTVQAFEYVENHRIFLEYPLIYFIGYS